ncbi:hypothetical protein, partial [Thermincola ferriacetica]|uniref:hypothetical protein n=1 Tax=Thermincola ferriacetica TaxID=281456 RepID=UPI001A9A4667
AYQTTRLFWSKTSVFVCRNSSILFYHLQIIQQSEKSKQELLDFIEKYNSGEISMNHTNDPDAVTALVSIPTNWEYWVCKFAGALSCTWLA